MNLVLLPQQTNPESPLACGNRRWQNARGKSSQVRGSSVQILRGMLLCLSVVFVAGCGSSGPELYPVCGKVSFEGQAISTGIVMFYPENGDRPAIGEIAADGTYQLRTYNDQPGAVLGKHKVTITARTEAAPGQEAGSEDRVAPVKGELVGTGSGIHRPLDCARSLLRARIDTAVGRRGSSREHDRFCLAHSVGPMTMSPLRCSR